MLIALDLPQKTLKYNLNEALQQIISKINIVIGEGLSYFIEDDNNYQFLKYNIFNGIYENQKQVTSPEAIPSFTYLHIHLLPQYSTRATSYHPPPRSPR